MTAKRFTTKNGVFYTDNLTGWEFQSYGEVVKLMNDLSDENEQLKQRNDRQAKQLDNLYHLIEKQDWKTLKGLIQEFQECEEQLQKEWQTYDDEND